MHCGIAQIVKILGYIFCLVWLDTLVEMVYVISKGKFNCFTWLSVKLNTQILFVGILKRRLKLATWIKKVNMVNIVNLSACDSFMWHNTILSTVTKIICFEWSKKSAIWNNAFQVQKIASVKQLVMCKKDLDWCASKT